MRALLIAASLLVALLRPVLAISPAEVLDGLLATAEPSIAEVQGGDVAGRDATRMTTGETHASDDALAEPEQDADDDDFLVEPHVSRALPTSSGCGNSSCALLVSSRHSCGRLDRPPRA